MSNIFDLTLLPSDQLTILKSMDKTTQFETIKRFLDIYRLSGAKIIEKFFSHDLHCKAQYKNFYLF